MDFYPEKIRRTWLQQHKHDQVQVSSQSPDSKHSHIHNSTICRVFLNLLPSFPSDIPYLAYPKVSYQFPQWIQVPRKAVATAAILEAISCYFLQQQALLSTIRMQMKSTCLREIKAGSWLQYGAWMCVKTPSLPAPLLPAHPGTGFPAPQVPNLTQGSGRSNNIQHTHDTSAWGAPALRKISQESQALRRELLFPAASLQCGAWEMGNIP